MITAYSASAYVGPDYPTWREALSDGSQVLIRPMRRQDADADRAFIQGLSAASRRMRFLGQMSSPSDELVDALTDIDYINDVALAAVIERDGKERIVGVSRYAVDATRRRCECAVVVADDWQKKGLGTALMQKLIKVAQERGLEKMESIDLAENAEMHGLAEYLGFRRRQDPDDFRQVIYSLQLNGTGSPTDRDHKPE